MAEPQAAPVHSPVLMLGGGLMGLAIAHQLACRGRSVTVLSRDRHEAAGFAAAGMLAPHAEGLEGALLALGQESLRRIPDWVGQVEADSGLACGLRNSGVVVPFRSSVEREAFPTARWGEGLDRAALERQVPGIGAGFRCGLLFAQDGQIDNRRRLMRALERACIQRGVRVLEGVEVQGLLRGGVAGELQGVTLTTAQGKRQILAAGQAVLCGGAWSGLLLSGLPVEPLKGQMLSLQAPREALPRVVFGPGTYLVPRQDGLVVVGATIERCGFHRELSPAGLRQLQRGIRELLPAASHWPLMERWSGFRPCTPDAGPLLGASGIPGLFLATGHHRNGVLLAAITASISTELICGTLDPVCAGLLQAFRWDRFRDRADIGLSAMVCR